MYPNLRAEMARKNIGVQELAEKIGVSMSVMYDKLKGKSKISLDDAFAIRSALDVDISLEDLFEKEVA